MAAWTASTRWRGRRSSADGFDDAREIGVKKNKRTGRIANAEDPATEHGPEEAFAAEEWKARVLQLQDFLAVCPRDILARCELATLLEENGQSDVALYNWRVVLVSNPNSLKAREGIVRCRQQIGRILSGTLGDAQDSDAGQC